MIDYDYLDWSLCDEVLSFEEMRERVDEEYKHMSEDEQHFRLVYCSPTFLQCILSSMHENNSVRLNEYACTYNIF